MKSFIFGVELMPLAQESTKMPQKSQSREVLKFFGQIQLK